MAGPSHFSFFAAITAFFNRRLVQPIFSLLRQGITPEKLALSVSLGVSLGIFPMIGSTTILCFVIGWIFRVNQPAIQLVNYFTYPLQLALLVPFLQMGSRIFGDGAIPFSLQDIFAMLTTDTWSAVGTLWWASVRAIAVWLLIGPLLTVILYILLKPLFVRLKETFQRTPAA